MSPGANLPVVSSSRVGITLIELTVCLAVMACMASLALPAISYTRESARTTTCKSHLKQMALGLTHYEVTWQAFPSGGWGYAWQGYQDIASVFGSSGDWTFAVLPYVEQGHIQDTAIYLSSPEVRDAALRQRLLSRVELFTCPSRRGGEPLPVVCNNGDCAPPIGIIGQLDFAVRGDYALNVGDGAPAKKAENSWPLDFKGPGDLVEAQQLTKSMHWPQLPDDFTGISYLGVGIRTSQISDGLSATLLIGEKNVMVLGYGTGLDWGDNESLFCGFNNDNHRSTNPYWPMMRDQMDTMFIGSFGAAHASGVNFALCDGSVRQLSYSVDQTILRCLGNRKDGEKIDEP